MLRSHFKNRKKTPNKPKPQQNQQNKTNIIHPYLFIQKSRINYLGFQNNTSYYKLSIKNRIISNRKEKGDDGKRKITEMGKKTHYLQDTVQVQ